MRHRVTIQRGVASRSSSGAPVVSWPPAVGTTEREVWTALAYQGGREFQAAKAIHSETELLFLLRAPVDVLPTDRILFQGEPFDIIAIDRHTSANIVRVQAKTATKP